MKNWNQGLIECVMAVGVAVSMCGCKGDKGTTGPQKAVISNSG